MKSTIKTIACFFSVASLLLASCSENAENQTQNISNQEQFRDASQVLASVNNVDITQTAFDIYKRGMVISEPGLSDAKILDKLIEFELLSQKAKEEGFANRSDIVAKIHLLTNELLSDTYIKQLITNLGNESLLLAEYERLKKENGSVEYLLRHIFAQSKAQITELQRQVKQNGFHQVANAHNQNNLGGIVGWVTPSEMIEPIRSILSSLKKAQLSEVIESEYGFHLVMIDEQRQTEFLPFEAAKSAIRSNVVEREVQEILDRLEKIADIEIYLKPTNE